MASSTLKLVILKGPRSGETLKFTPKSTVRIGRVVRGNNLPIKDSGISSKHLAIEFNSDSGKWVITDLDSSNGTIVNSTQLKPLSPFEIFHQDEIKVGELTSIRVEIGEILDNCRNPRNQGSSNLGENVEIGEEVGNCRNPKTRAASRSGIELGENVEVREENKKRRNLRSRAASKRGDDLGNKVEILNSEEKSLVKDMKEENVEKVYEGNQRGWGRRRPPKKVSNLEDGNLGDMKNVENVKLMVESGVSTRRTRSLKRKEDELLSGVEVMPAKRTRSKKKAEDVMEKIAESRGLDMDDGKEVVGNKEPEMTNVLDFETRTRSTKNAKDVMVESKGSGMDNCEEALGSKEPATMNALDLEMRTRSTKNAEDVMVSSVMEKVVESKGLDMDDCKEVESISVVRNAKARGGRGRKKKVSAGCSENVQDVALEEKIHQEMPEKECPEMVVELKELPCEGPVDDALEKNALSDMKNEEFMEVEGNVQDSVPKEKMNYELLDMEVPEKVDDQRMKESEIEKVDDQRIDEANNVKVDDQRMEESEIEKVDGQQTEESDTENVDIESEAICYGRNKDVQDADDEDVVEKIVESKGLDMDNCKEVFGRKDPETTIVLDLDKMTLEDWFNYLEVYLPKQIYAATDEIIEDMRERVTQFNNFMLQQQKEKSSLPLDTEKARS